MLESVAFSPMAPHPHSIASAATGRFVCHENTHPASYVHSVETGFSEAVCLFTAGDYAAGNLGRSSFSVQKPPAFQLCYGICRAIFRPDQAAQPVRIGHHMRGCRLKHGIAQCLCG